MLPSVAEAFGLVLVEAMACGLPVIAADAHGPAEIVAAGTGWLVPADDQPALAETLLSVGLRPAGAKTARQTAPTSTAGPSYGWPLIVARVATLYDEVAAASTRSGLRAPEAASRVAFTELSPHGLRNAAASAARPVASVGKRVPMRTLATRYELLRHRLADGEETTVYVVRYPRLADEAERRALRRPAADSTAGADDPASAKRSSAASSSAHAAPPLGELWIDGRRIETEPVPDPYRRRERRSHVEQGEIRIGPRAELPPAPAGHLLQAGPLLVRDGTPLRHLHDAEGFVAGAHQFDSDITSGRHPRAALAISDEELTALVCDGRRTGIDAGLTLTELADLIADLGANQAINLDGGGSTALIHHGHLLNHPYDRPRPPKPQPPPGRDRRDLPTAPAQSARSEAA